ncbi:hypothetical protein TIFTF001_040155 [Ficus carica]|uniref:Uncharacterized protein n=1 Tax=Ficus carica TaxID=3494 RepID=A0AA87Z5L5_FICCA|nr:hypothetical protein TIFTF001_040155 [Ficus carica]
MNRHSNTNESAAATAELAAAAATAELVAAAAMTELVAAWRRKWALEKFREREEK